MRFYGNASGNTHSLTGHLTLAHCHDHRHADSLYRSYIDSATPLFYPFCHAYNHSISVLANGGSQRIG